MRFAFLSSTIFTFVTMLVSLLIWSSVVPFMIITYKNLSKTSHPYRGEYLTHRTPTGMETGGNAAHEKRDTLMVNLEALTLADAVQERSTSSGSLVANRPTNFMVHESFKGWVCSDILDSINMSKDPNCLSFSVAMTLRCKRIFQKSTYERNHIAFSGNLKVKSNSSSTSSEQSSIMTPVSIKLDYVTNFTARNIIKVESQLPVKLLKTLSRVYAYDAHAETSISLLITMPAAVELCLYDFTGQLLPMSLIPVKTPLNPKENLLRAFPYTSSPQIMVPTAAQFGLEIRPTAPTKCVRVLTNPLDKGLPYTTHFVTFFSRAAITALNHTIKFHAKASLTATAFAPDVHIKVFLAFQKSVEWNLESAMRDPEAMLVRSTTGTGALEPQTPTQISIQGTGRGIYVTLVVHVATPYHSGAHDSTLIATICTPFLSVTESGGPDRN